ncbi:hypothetical protein WR25_11492 [Diploscapter pachys]|uniref:JAB1/MPN/MOV34 metalloenzyme domain-containing protein n=1 Tax=Diploscapter pachys TaxID=2018661 RepID=A0A2A2JPY0_9BILA|nr:hypothetical protein WR25_11492 [Diploscapter pachys]
MASNLCVKVHPVVYMTIVDSYQRRSKSVKNQMSDKALGTLMGFYEKGAVQVSSLRPFIGQITDALRPEFRRL